MRKPSSAFPDRSGTTACDPDKVKSGQRQNGGSWLHVLSHLHPKYGGVSAVVPQLDSAIAATEEYSIQLAGFCARGEEFVPPNSENIRISYLPLGRRDWLLQPSARQMLTSWVASSSGVHIHGLWQPSTTEAARLARKANKPYLISAHGMLEPWALANKRWKKQIYLALVERTNLRGAACLHALTPAEAEDYRRLGLRNPIAIIPNGVQIPSQTSSRAFLARFPSLAGKRIVLFLGRIHFKKGLDILCQAWSRLTAQWPEAQLVLAGPDFEGTQAVIQHLVRDLRMAQKVTFTGMLSGEMKWSALAASEIFVLPSYSEGLSVSVLEAMGMAKPVVITENCNLPEVSTFGCGSVIRANAEELRTALNEALQQSTAGRFETGLRGEKLVSTRYSWRTIGHQMASVYSWLQGASLPENVEIQLTGDQA